MELKIAKENISFEADYDREMEWLHDREAEGSIDLPGDDDIEITISDTGQILVKYKDNGNWE